jgi:hypothetical protein
MTTVTTVGYGDKYPMTAAGRGIAVALMLVGIAAFGLVTANLAALFVEEQEDEVKTRLREVNERLIRVQAALERALHEQDARQKDTVSSVQGAGAGPVRVLFRATASRAASSAVMRRMPRS